MDKIRVMQMGLGPIGQEACRIALERSSLEVVAAVDLNKEIVGKRLEEVLGRAAPDVAVTDDAEKAVRETKPHIIVHCTSSFIGQVKEQLLFAAKHGVNLVSSTEELLDPWFGHPQQAEEIHKAAEAGGATILGTGVNPGFVLDLMAVFASGACRRVERIEGRRVVDAATRRGPLQLKVGAGLSKEEFEERVRQDKLGHRGLRESISIVARAIGWKCDEIAQQTEPVISDREIKTDYCHVMPGAAAGIKNTGWAICDGRCVVELDLRMYVGAPNPMDEVKIHGEPNMTLRVDGGIPGDVATAAILVNAIPRVVAAPPGLKTILDVPFGHYYP